MMFLFCLNLFLSLTFFFFFFNDTATTEIYTLSLHDALPISRTSIPKLPQKAWSLPMDLGRFQSSARSEEHTSELQSPCNLVCRLLLEKKKNLAHPNEILTTTHFQVIQ